MKAKRVGADEAARLVAVFTWCLPKEWIPEAEIVPKASAKSLSSAIAAVADQPPPGVQVRKTTRGTFFRLADPKKAREFIGQLRTEGEST